jgi:hypothetical protein
VDSKAEAIDPSESIGWEAPAVWADVETFEGNPVSQLLIPESAFVTVLGEAGRLELGNNYGTWPAAPQDAPLDDDMVWARLPVSARPGDAITGARWATPLTIHRHDAAEVLESMRGRSATPSLTRIIPAYVHRNSGPFTLSWATGQPSE